MENGSRQNQKRLIPIAVSPLAAGDPIDISDDFDYLDLNEIVTGGREGYMAYRVTGDSMVTQILPGYIVIADSYCEPQHGDVIVARINGLNCVKILDKNRGLHLVSANKEYTPRRVTKADDFQIIGVVRGHVAIYRK